VIIVVLPLRVMILQGLEGGVRAALRAIDAGSARVLLLHSDLVAAVTAPLAGLLGVSAAWFTERTHCPPDRYGLCWRWSRSGSRGPGSL
jgi:ABC-type sulfate transport system permease subunit